MRRTRVASTHGGTEKRSTSRRSGPTQTSHSSGGSERVPASEWEGADRNSDIPESLQATIGNRQVARLLGTDMAFVHRIPDTPVELLINDRDGDSTFNADTIVNDLRRAIDASQVDAGAFLKSDDADPKRSVDVVTVLRVLDNRTAPQMRAVQALYRARESRGLEDDLFGKGASGYSAKVTPLERARIEVLLRGTKGEPTSPALMEGLRGLPPAVAGPIQAAMGSMSVTTAKLNQLEADAIEIRELIGKGVKDETRRERLMALHRRSVAEIAIIDGYYEHRFGMALGAHLSAVLSELQLNRMAELRAGRREQADACAIEDKRRIFEKLKSETPDMGNITDIFIEKAKKKALADIQGIVELNRREVLAGLDAREESDASEPGVAKSASAAMNERMGKILGTPGAEKGETVSSLLTGTFGAAKAGAITTTATGSMIDVHAHELLEMEASGTTSTDKIEAILQQLRSEARADLMTIVTDPWASAAEKQRIAKDKEEATTDLAREYIGRFRVAYASIRGTARSFEEIVERESQANQDRLLNLSFGGGEYTSDVMKLDLAIRRKDVDMVKDVLRSQSDGTKMNALEHAYNATHKVSLRVELFGVHIDEDERAKDLAGTGDNAEKAATSEGFERQVMGGLLSGRDASAAKESLTKPSEMGGADEVEWLARSGSKELSVTMANRGWSGAARELGDVPETQQILEESHGDLKTLERMWKEEKTEARRGLILLAMRKVRSTLTGDATAYEEDNARVLAEIRAAVTFAIQIALAIALPGAGPGIIGFINATVINVAASVATNFVVSGGDYGWKNLQGDVLTGVLGAAGGKLGEEFLGTVARTITGDAARAATSAAERAGMASRLAREAEAAGFGAKEMAAFGKLEQEAALAAQAAKAAAKTPLAQVGTAIEKGMQQAGNYGGSTATTSLYTGQNGFTADEFGKALLLNLAGMLNPHGKAKAGEKEPGVGGEEGGASAGSKGSGAAEAAEALPKEGGPIAANASAGAEHEGVQQAAEHGAEAAMQPQSVPGRSPTASPPNVHVSQASGIPQVIVETAKIWPTLNVQERISYIKRALNERLSALGLPELGVVGRLNDTGGGQFTTTQNEIAISEHLLTKPRLGTEDVAALANTVRHEVEHAIQWAEMAQHLAAQGASVEGIMANMGADGTLRIPERVARWAVEEQRAGRGMDLSSPQARAAAANWGSVYGDQSNPQGKTRGQVYAELNAAEKALKDLDAFMRENPSSPAEQLRTDMRRRYDEASAAYRDLAEERGPHLAGDTAAGEARALADASQPPTSAEDAADTQKMAKVDEPDAGDTQKMTAADHADAADAADTQMAKVDEPDAADTQKMTAADHADAADAADTQKMAAITEIPPGVDRIGTRGEYIVDAGSPEIDLTALAHRLHTVAELAAKAGVPAVAEVTFDTPLDVLRLATALLGKGNVHFN